LKNIKETYLIWCIFPKNALAQMKELERPKIHLALRTVGSEELEKLRITLNPKEQRSPILELLL
jgi:hypothetical protein